MSGIAEDSIRRNRSETTGAKRVGNLTKWLGVANFRPIHVHEIGCEVQHE
jgi:hypothetical protein